MSKTISPRKSFEPGAPTVLILVGLPGSGKSTWIKKYFEACVTKTVVASTDDILERFAREDETSYAVAHQTRFKEAEREFKVMISDAAREGLDIIIDRTNVFPSARRKIIALIESHTKVVYRRIAVVFDRSDDVLRAQLAKRVEEGGKPVPWEAIETMKEGMEMPYSGDYHEIRTV